MIYALRIVARSWLRQRDSTYTLPKIAREIKIKMEIRTPIAVITTESQEEDAKEAEQEIEEADQGSQAEDEVNVS